VDTRWEDDKWRRDTWPGLDALRIYALNSAWRTFDGNERWSLEVGKLSDPAVLDRDYMSVPIHDIAKIESVLTIVGGKIVYAVRPFDQSGPRK
jgi:predicted amidohydrolase YtcJ